MQQARTAEALVGQVVVSVWVAFQLGDAPGEPVAIVVTEAALFLCHFDGQFQVIHSQ